MKDATNPKHYKSLTPEPITVIEGWGLGFNLGNTVKYISRCELKGATIEDLKKARWYLDREISKREARKHELEKASGRTKSLVEKNVRPGV